MLDGKLPRSLLCLRLSESEKREINVLCFKCFASTAGRITKKTQLLLVEKWASDRMVKRFWSKHTPSKANDK